MQSVIELIKLDGNVRNWFAALVAQRVLCQDVPAVSDFKEWAEYVRGHMLLRSVEKFMSRAHQTLH